MRPRRIIQIVSPDMRQRSEWLADVLRSRNLHIERWEVDDAWDIEHIQRRVLELLDKELEECAENAIALNVTGGTKPMSIAAFDTCRLYKLPVFYVHPEHDRIIWLHPHGLEPYELTGRIKLEPFLQAHGAKLEGEPGRNIPQHNLLETGQEIIQRIDKFQKPLGQLNWLANTACNDLHSAQVKDDRGDLSELINLFEQGGYLQRGGNHLHFPDKNARFFVNGGWLEYLVFDAVRKLRKQDKHIQDIARNVKVKREQHGKPIPNELDIAFLRNNRLHIIECKTRRFPDEGADSPGADALYKLDTLADLMGGLQARTMLVSYRDIAGHDRDRASNLNISVCAGAQLRQLGKHIEAFCHS